MLRKLHSAVVGRGINLVLCVTIIFSFTPITPSPTRLASSHRTTRFHWPEINIIRLAGSIFAMVRAPVSSSPARIQAAQLDTTRAEIPMRDSTYKSGQAIHSPDTSEPAFGDRLAVWTSSHSYEYYPLAADDAVRIVMTRPDSSTWSFYHKSYTQDYAPIDLEPHLGIGANQIHIELIDLVPPKRGGSWFYLLLGDTIPPAISNVRWRQDGEGRTLVEATITDNVSVAAASLWWNGQEFPMQLAGSDRYYVIVPKNPNGIVGHFRIIAIDPSSNLGYWPANGLTQEERVRYTDWINQENIGIVGEPVNSAIGSFSTQHQDLLVPGIGMPFQFKRSYDSVASAFDGPLGFGWTHTYNLHLQVVDDPLLHGVVITFEDGRTANFEVDGSGYRSPPGDHDILAHEGSGFVLTRPDQFKYHFNSGGKLVRLEDRNGNTIQLAYTGDNLTQIIDTAGRAYHFEYTGHRISRITDALGRTYEYTYDGDGNLRTYRDPEDGLLQYTYNSEHWLFSITDPNGHVFVSNTYDDRGRVVAQSDASGNSSSIAYLDEQHVLFTDNEGNATAHEYDDHLRLIDDRDALGKSITYEYDGDNNVIRSVDRGGHPTVYTYDNRGNMLTRQDVLSGTATFHYDAQNNVTYKRDEAGAETIYEYDPHGNLTHTLDAEGGNTWFTYDSRGLMQTARDANGSLTQFTYDGQGNLETTKDALHNVAHFQHDAVGRRIAMTDANLHTVRFTYDRNDHVTAITDAKGKTTTFTYDRVGNLRSTTDRRSYKTYYEYNENDSLIMVTDPRGYFTSFTYDRMYHRKTLTDKRGHTTSYQYDAVYNLVKTVDAKGNATVFEFDADGNLVKLTDALLQSTVFERDALHRVAQVTDAMNGETKYQYDPVGRPLQLRDPKGGITRYEYDRLGRLLKQRDALSNLTQFTYDPVGHRTSVTNARGFATRYQYDAIGQLIQQMDPLDHTLRMTYDGVGNVLTLTNRRGNSTTFTYDANDNLVQVFDAMGGRISYSYNEEDHRLSATDQNNHTTTFAYDPVGNTIRTTLPLGQATSFEYDENGNLIATTNAKSKTTRFAYDELDLLISRTDPLNLFTTYVHDELRRLIKVTDAENTTTQYRYDALDRLIKVIEALNGHANYEYDPLGNLAAFTDANGHRTWFDIDLLGRVTGETSPLGNHWQYQYDPVGNLVRRIDANNVITQYTFDPDDRLMRIIYPSGPSVDWGYDENDNPVYLVDASGQNLFTYDALDRLTHVQRTAGILAGKTLGYGYDAVANRTRITYPDGKVVRYAYNANDWLTSVTDPMAGVTGYIYDPVGLPTNIQYPNGTWADYGYDDANRLVWLFNGKPEAGTNLISSFDYTLDKVGNRIRTVERDTRGQVVTWDKRYTYDKLYQLLRAVETPDYNPAQVLTSLFSYDAVGNRLSMTTNIQDKPNTPALPSPITTHYTYNAANQMLTAGLTRFTYDANGNRISMVGAERAINYTYDFENRLNGAQTHDILPIWLTLDPHRGQIMEPITLHSYQYVRNNPINLVDFYGYSWLSDRWEGTTNWLQFGKWETITQREIRLAKDRLLQQRLAAERKANDVNKALAEKLMKTGYNKAGPSDNCFLYVRAQRDAMGKATPEWRSAAQIISWIKEFPGMDVPPTYIIGDWWRENHEKHPDVKTAEQMAKLYNEANPGQNLSANQFFKVGRGKPTVVGAIMLEIQEVSDRLNNNDVGHVSLVDRIDDAYCENGWHIREANYPYGQYHQTCVYDSMMEPYFLY